MPLKVGVLMFVMLSVFDEPLSLALVRSGVEMFGKVVSIVIGRGAEAVPTFPAASLARAVMLCMPLESALEVMVQFPRPSAVVVPTGVVPSQSVTLAPGSLVPVNVGVVSFVMLSIFETPVSLASVRSGADGVPGAVVSIVTVSGLEMA